MNEKLFLKTKTHLQTLCLDISDRSVGSLGNRHATEYFKNELIKNNWNTEETLLHVMDWKTNGAALQCGQTSYEVFSSPYSLGCATQGNIVSVTTINELDNKELLGKIVSRRTQYFFTKRMSCNCC